MENVCPGDTAENILARRAAWIRRGCREGSEDACGLGLGRERKTQMLWGIKGEGKVGFAVEWSPKNHQVSIEVPCG